MHSQLSLIILIAATTTPVLWWSAVKASRRWRAHREWLRFRDGEHTDPASDRPAVVVARDDDEGGTGRAIMERGDELIIG